MHGKLVLPPQIEAGKLRALAVTAGERWPESPISAFRSLRDELALQRKFRHLILIVASGRVIVAVHGAWHGRRRIKGIVSGPRMSLRQYQGRDSRED
jgi:hypothetical protein